MPRFFFNFRHDHGLDRDEDGVDLPDFETAYLEAYRGALDIFVESRRNGRDPDFTCIEVRDTNDTLVLDVPIAEVLGIHLAPTRQWHFTPRFPWLKPPRDELGALEGALALGEEQIADQRARISRLEAKNCDASFANRLLATMLETQTMRRRHLDLLGRMNAAR